MGQLKLSTASGGSITLDPTNTASNFTVTIPAGNGTVNTSGAVNQVPAGSASAPSIFPTGDSNTGIYFPAADTIAFTEGGTEQMRLTSTGDLQMNSGYGSVATAYGCRAWVNFNGTGTVAIRASGNVSSITDNGTGNYRINFTNSLPDANFCCVDGQKTGIGSPSGISTQIGFNTYTTTAVNVTTENSGNGSYVDVDLINVAVFR